MAHSFCINVIARYRFVYNDNIIYKHRKRSAAETLLLCCSKIRSDN